MRTTIAYIEVGNLKHNLDVIQKAAGNAALLAIVKANAYGHGINEVAKHISEQVHSFGVAFVEEGISLRNSGITNPVVVLVPDINDAVHYCDYRLQPAVSNIEFLKVLSAAASRKKTKVKVHLYIDTGMRRDGIYPETALDFFNEVNQLPYIEISGLLSHFATSSTDLGFAKRQYIEFQKVIKEFTAGGIKFEYVHLSNSRGVFNLPEASFNMIRTGLALYGYPQDKETLEKFDLKPVLSLKSTVISTRRIQKGDLVGYDAVFVADKPTNIATIPIGYGDGYLKSLQGKAQCLINGKRYSIVGTICMDESMVDTGDDVVCAGDEVVLIGEQGNEKILANELASKAGTIIYDVLTAIAARVPRVYL